MVAGIKKNRPQFFSTFFKNFYNVGVVSHPVSSEIVDWSRNVAMLFGLNATLGCANAFATTDFRSDLAAFNVSTLVIHGAGDEIVPIDATGRVVAKSVPGATYIEYDGAPHGLFATHKERLTEDLLAFLRQ